MELRQLRYFLALAETLHFRQAAEQLHIVQPALSRQIKSLEADLGIMLLERDKRSVALTAAGAHFRERLTDWFYELEEICRDTQQVAQGERGALRIGYVGSCIHTIFPRLLPRIHQEVPLVQINLSEMVTAIQLTALQEGKLDVGFLRNPPLDERFAQQVVFREPYALVLPQSHALTEADFRSLNQVADEPFIMPARSDGENYYRFMMELCEETGFAPHVAHESVHGQTILKLIELGLGLSILPISFSQIAGDQVKFIPLRRSGKYAELTAYWRRDNPNPALKKLLGILG